MSVMDQWFLIGVAVFGISTLIHLIALWRPDGRTPHLAQRTLEGCLIFWFLLLLCWSLRFGGEGFNRLLLGVSGWSVAALYRLSLQRYPLQSVGSVISALATLLTTFSLFFTRPLQLDPNASRWLLFIHIGLAIIGLTAFTLSAVCSGLYLIQERRLKAKQLPKSKERSRLPSLFVLDRWCLRGLLIGFPFYTIALLMGSAQAVRSQGSLHLSYVVALVSWLIYGGVLQARLTAGWRGRRAAWLTLIAFIGVLAVIAQYSLRA